VCGGYTSKNWDGSQKWTDDIDAFVFNMTQKYILNNRQQAIHTSLNGFLFGNNILGINSSSTLNKQIEGKCWAGKKYGYDIEGDVSPLTNQQSHFTCGKLEVHKVVY
jgi:hypothetical protein